MNNLDDLTLEELGWLRLAASQQKKKDEKGAERFGDDLDPESPLAARAAMAPRILRRISKRMKQLRELEDFPLAEAVDYLRHFGRSVAHSRQEQDALAVRIGVAVRGYDRRKGDVSVSRKLKLIALYKEARALRRREHRAQAGFYSKAAQSMPGQQGGPFGREEDA